MSEQDKRPPGPPENPWNRLDAKVGLHLAFWAYPHKDPKKAEEIAKYPAPWRHAEPGEHLPAEWRKPLKDAQGRLLQEGWNTQHNASGKLENRFMVSINRETKEITFVAPVVMSGPVESLQVEMFGIPIDIGTIDLETFCIGQFNCAVRIVANVE